MPMTITYDGCSDIVLSTRGRGKPLGHFHDIVIADYILFLVLFTPIHLLTFPLLLDVPFSLPSPLFLESLLSRAAALGASIPSTDGCLGVSVHISRLRMPGMNWYHCDGNPSTHARWDFKSPWNVAKFMKVKSTTRSPPKF